MKGFFTRTLLAIALAIAIANGVQAKDAGFAEPLQQQLANLRERDDHDAADAMEAFYALSGSAPVWNEPGRIESLALALEELENDGLDPEAYGLPAIRAHALSAGPSMEICSDVAITHAYLRALMHLSRGRLSQAGVEPMWRDSGTPPDPSLRDVAGLGSAGLDDVHASFERARPSTPAYQALREHYRALLSQPPRIETLLPPGPTLKPGDHHPVVTLLRARLAAFGYETETDTALAAAQFDVALEAMVREFQHAHHLEPDGVVGRQTRAALNATLEQRKATVRANLERWRWLTPEFRPRQLRVDVAAASIAYVRDGKTIWSSRVQVGREARPTPLLHSTISHVSFNPPWVVPPTILRHDKLPEIRANPDVLTQNHFRVLDPAGRELDPQTINWNAPGPITLRQDPGPLSALGQVAIRFPNPFSIYLHDTPSQRLFTSWQRAFSSGCVRVERAVELAELLLADEDGVPARQRVAGELATSDTSNVRLVAPVPVLIAYWTADVDDAGQLRFRPDIYGHDARISAALELAHSEPHVGWCRPVR